MTNFVSDNNCFYPDGAQLFYWANGYASSFTDWKTKSTQDSHSLSTDPQFQDISARNFSLTKGSPCIDQGADVGLAKDFNGTSIPLGKIPDIGAMEFPDTSFVRPPGILKVKPQ